jgi:hypothetical protein
VYHTQALHAADALSENLLRTNWDTHIQTMDQPKGLAFQVAFIGTILKFGLKGKKPYVDLEDLSSPEATRCIPMANFN